MNCKPNELAIIVKSERSEFLGTIVTTIYLAPKGVLFDLPDGFGHAISNSPLPQWVCEFPRPISAPLASGKSSRMTRFACVADRCLKPLRGDEEPEATETGTLLEKPFAMEGGTK